ncbi:SHOCT domain-containing protein [Olsenella sp. YH-ols2217]|uniref:SHOCT domain-containing protein n=1 Tax=Kribbibacterium absianum TaxID=3044210 RepID=A0ABT6ZKE8_9ACTN|nr:MULTISPECIES: SHOCT domain-containing protein [unclassified Olsenella]MDJ1122512.1 SHOCT domain-containing protein [Olsenella sp. YH-ols2216]MDJ1129528.1 SHOCT domain-containing protein [Olsenella sp. YH-ols2217]
MDEYVYEDEPTLDEEYCYAQESGPTTEAQANAKAEQAGYQLMKAAAALPIVRIDRESFLRSELAKRCPDVDIDLAVATTPLQAGVSPDDIDLMATDAINVETNRCAGVSFLAGIPGGLGMLATVPADLTQYLGHAMRVEQKLAYLYGWQSFMDDNDQVDDRTIMEFTLLLGVMMGVGSAATALNAFAAKVAQQGVAKAIERQALTKTVFYPALKKVLRVVGVNMTKKTFANAAGKMVPVVGGAISGGMTYAAFKPSAIKLREYLRGLPISGFDPNTPIYREGPTIAEQVGTAAQGAAKAAAPVVGAAGAAMADGAKAAGKFVGSLFKGPRVDTKPTADQPQEDPVETLKKMKELLDLGILTQEEFDTKKRQLLGI